MLLGIDYYPEQWPAELLDEDLSRIRRLGARTIRIGEFAWHLMEPRPGAVDFSFFDHVIARAKEHGLNVIMGTPTATPPSWLAAREDIASVDEHGCPRSYGGRHTASVNAPAYREACERIVRALAEHYRGESAIIAWQIDNEVGHEGADVCWSAHSHRRFQEWLAEKYEGDIDALNERWGTIFWSQTYNSFSDIPLPAPTITTHNPSLRLEWERFCSWTIEDFVKSQVEWLRASIPDAVIMHDFPGGGLEKSVDYARVARHIDTVGYNNYPVWGGQMRPIPPSEIAFGLDYMRGLRRGQPFWITEAIMGAQGHDVIGFLPRTGQAALWSAQALARGANGISFFRYRGATRGAEQFCYGIIDPENVEGRRFREAQGVYRFAEEHAELFDSPIEAPIALLTDFDSRRAFSIQQQAAALDVVAELKAWHAEFYRRHLLVDVLSGPANLDGYRVIVVPHALIYREAYATRLRAAAEAGAQVLITCRSFIKDEDNNLVFGEQLPLGGAEWLGVRIAETEALDPADRLTVYRCGGSSILPATGTVGVLRDMVEPAQGTDVLYEFRDPFFPDLAAITRRRTGSGAAWWIGAVPDAGLRSALIDDVLDAAQLRPAADLPAGVELVERGGRRILLNHNETPARVLGQHLEPFGVRVMEA